MAHWHDTDRALRPIREQAAAPIVTGDQIKQIHESFDAIWPVHRALAAAFYQRFFELAPDARRTFPAEMAGRQRKLVNIIAGLVGALTIQECSRRSAVPQIPGMYSSE